MVNKEKVLPEVGAEWLIGAIFERYRPEFESFCQRKGYLLPMTARMPKDKSAAMWKDGNAEQEQLDEDEGELEAIQSEIFDYQETVLSYEVKRHAEKKKAFEKRWKEKDRGSQSH
jgi:hypothetical protein